MDEMWQRHKSFILQVMAGGVMFLIAYFVMNGMYGDQNDPKAVRTRNVSKLQDLNKKVEGKHAPDTASIEQQRTIAKSAEDEMFSLAKRVSSVAGLGSKRDVEREAAWVKESIDWVLANIQRPDDGYVDLFNRVPQACLSRLRDAARQVVVGKAAQSGKEIDETLGLTAFPDDEIPEALHGLAIVTDLVGRALARPGIEKVVSIRVATHSTFPENNEVSLVRAIGVHMDLIGDPADVAEFLRSLNAVGQAGQRMTVLESVESVVPISQDEDTVKASINVVGLQYASETK
jgi:hypothetical protein